MGAGNSTDCMTSPVFALTRRSSRLLSNTPIIAIVLPLGERAAAWQPTISFVFFLAPMLQTLRKS